MDLEKELPEGAVYLPADLVQRDARTVVVDLNGGSVPDLAADVVTLLGVMEYVHDLAGLLTQLAQRWPRLIASYNPTDLDHGRDRRSHGWFNDLSSSQVVAMAIAAGYRLDAIVPYGLRERLYAFSSAKPET